MALVRDILIIPFIETEIKLVFLVGNLPIILSLFKFSTMLNTIENTKLIDHSRTRVVYTS